MTRATRSNSSTVMTGRAACSKSARTDSLTPLWAEGTAGVEALEVDEAVALVEATVAEALAVAVVDLVEATAAEDTAVPVPASVLVLVPALVLAALKPGLPRRHHPTPSQTSPRLVQRRTRPSTSGM